jgi:hypothetical protein
MVALAFSSLAARVTDGKTFTNGERFAVAQASLPVDLLAPAGTRVRAEYGIRNAVLTGERGFFDPVGRGPSGPRKKRTRRSALPLLSVPIWARHA